MEFCKFSDPIRDALLLFSDDTGTTVLRIFAGFDWFRQESHEYWQELTTNYKNLFGILHERYESVTNQLRIRRMHVQIRYK